MIDPKGVLMIEPTHSATAAPKTDYWTYKAALVYGLAQPSDFGYRGVHTCICGVNSDNYDHILPDGRVTNSLMVHYVTYHRADVPSDEIFKIDQLFTEHFADFDYGAFDADTERQRELLAAVPAPAVVG